MQLNSSYLYPNKIDVYTNLGSWTTERYRKVYQRPFKTYRGVDNRLDLQIRNSDQKTKNITGYTVVFNLLTTDGGELIKQKDCTIVDALTGKVFVTLTEGDMLDLVNGFYYFSAYVVHSDGTKTPLYGDSQYGAIGQLEVLGDVYGDPKPSYEETNFTNVDGTYYSSAIDAKPQFQSNAALHTFAFYFTDYTQFNSGDIIIQGSLDNSTNPVEWVDIDTVTPAANVDYKNITGVWGHLRIKNISSTATIDKVLYRY